MKTSSELKNFIQSELDTANITFADSDYSLPSEEWIFGAFKNSFEQFKTLLNTNVWHNQSWDCDNFAKLGACWADILHSQSKTLTGIAVGEFWYDSEVLGGPHAINIFIYKDSDGHKIGFFEPQTGEEVVLTDSERYTAYFIKL